jgi:hypothetical protein
VTETQFRPSGPRFTELVVGVFIFGIATLGAAARLLGGQKGWDAGYDDTLILAVSSTFWVIGFLDLVSGSFLLAKRRLGWAWVAVSASLIQSLGSLVALVGTIHDGGLGGNSIHMAFFILPFPVLLSSLLSLRRNRRVPGARTVGIAALLMVAAIFAGYFGFSRRRWDNYCCKDCGAVRDVRYREEPYFRTRTALYEDTVTTTALSRLIEQRHLLPTPHEHRWLPGETPTSFGGAAGWKKEAENRRVVAFVDDLFRHRGSAKATWGIGLALKIQTLTTPLSSVLKQDAYPESGFPAKEDFDSWMVTYESQLAKQIAKSPYQLR